MDARHFFVGIAAAALTACGVVKLPGSGIDGSGKIVVDARTVPAFDRVSVEDEFDVEVAVGPAAAVEVTGDDNLLPHVRTEVRGGTLHVETDRDLDPTDRIRVRVATSSLRGLASSGSSNVHATGVRATVFEARVSGSSDVAADGDFGDLSASISGSGKIRLRGTGDSIDALISGSGALDLAGLEVRAARVRVSGSGDAILHARESLAASVSGSGSVRYHGDPRVKSTVSGSGSVHPARSNH